jgi:rhamnosyltransferase
MLHKNPKVAVLLATYNGENNIIEQLISIANQKNVDVKLIISDDGSSDRTIDLVKNSSLNNISVSILPSRTMGSAATNFFRLVSDSDIEEVDFIAFSDQDDIWFEDKLHNAVLKIIADNADAYSSNVMAFWSDGSEKIIKKAQPQKEYDYMFESAGPGCTYLLTKNLVIELKKFLLANQGRLKNVALHDWFVYAFARSRGYVWVIDNSYYVLYRQHSNNVVGANVGIKAKVERWKKMRGGWHRNQTLLLGSLLEYEQKFPISALKRYYLIDRFNLIINIRKFRRSINDGFALALFFFVTPKK